MQYRVDKKSGNKLSVLGFGCMRFPRSLGAIDLRKTEALICEAAAQGVNYFDTAYVYPGSEEALGTILERNNLRDKVYVASKLPLIYCRAPEDFEKFFSKELERLRTDHIDYYLCHMITSFAHWEQFRNWGIEAWMAEKKKAGQVRQMGFSFHGSRDDFLKVLDAWPWEFCQIQYNYSDENYQAGVVGLKKAAETMSVMIMEPLLGGKLAAPPKKAAAIFKEAAPDRSPAAWALNWVWDQAEPTVVLSGMNEESQLRENLAWADKSRPGMIGEADRDVYRRVIAELNAAYKIRCTGCNYCMPCPRNVNIPGSFAAYNTSFSLGRITGMQQYVTSIGLTSAKWGGPVQCVKCGKCESHCPQHLPIIKNLEEVRRRMEPPPIRAAFAIARRVMIKDR